MISRNQYHELLLPVVCFLPQINQASEKLLHQGLHKSSRLSERIFGRVLVEDIVSRSGDIILKAGDLITNEALEEIVTFSVFFCIGIRDF